LIRASLPQLLEATQLTVIVSFAAFALAIVVGLIFAAARRSHVLPVRGFAFIYVNLFRGAALYVLVIWLFNGLAVATGLLLSAITVGVLALTLLNSAYLTEVFRSSIDAVDRGQWEAAQAIGLSRWDVFHRVIAPQAARVAIPATGNHLIDALKDSAILAVIAVPELMFVSNRIANSTFRPFEMYVSAAAIYLVIVYTVALALRWLERRLEIERRVPVGGILPR
ncbi:MAG: amino acid ABC transporter permease, partial [Nitriliruptoraceae bacterium]